MEYLLLLVIGIFSSAFFSGLETGVYSVNRIRLQVLKEERGKKLLSLLEHTKELIASILVGINLSNYLCSASLTSFFLALSIAQPEVLATFLLTPFLFVFGEILPKEIFRRYADILMLRLTPFLSLFYRLCYPLSCVVLALGKLMEKSLKRSQEDLQLTRQKIRLFLLDRFGAFSSLEQMAQNIFHLEKKRVGDVMRPIRQVACLKEDWGKERILFLVRRAGFSRYPVWDKERKRMLGVVHIYDIFFYPEEEFSLRKILRPVERILSSTSVPKALEQLRRQRVPLGLVVDEKGKVLGIVSVKDLVENVVGGISHW